MTASRTLLVTLLLVAAPAPARARGELWGHTARAVGLMVEGQLDAAVGELARARKVKAAPELDALVGLVALQGGEAKAAVKQLERAIQHGSTEPLVFYWAARAQLSAGQRGRALARLRQGLAIADRPALHMLHALLLQRAGKAGPAATALHAAARGQPNLLDPSLYPTPVEGAVDLMGRVLAGFPARLQLVRTQGHLLWQAGRVTAACRRFRELRVKSPADADALQMQAQCSLAVGETDAALQLVQQALEKAPTSPHALATRGEILLRQGQAEQAVKDLRKAADLLPRDARLLTRLARACTEAEQPACAHKFFGYAIRRDPGSAAAAFGFALQLQQAGSKVKPTGEARLKLVRRLFQRAVALAPDRPRYWRAAARFASQQGERARARRWLAEARHAAGVERRLKALRGRMARVSQAVHAMARALEQKRCDPSCRRLLRKTPRPVRQFAALHLAARREGPGAPTAGVLPRLALRRLILEDPTVYEHKARTLGGRRYVVRISFPYVPPWRLTAPQPAKNPESKAQD